MNKKMIITLPPRRIVRETNSEFKTRASAIYGFGSFLFCFDNEQGEQKRALFPLNAMCELGSDCTKSCMDLKGVLKGLIARQFAHIENNEMIDIRESDDSGIIFVAFEKQSPLAWVCFSFDDFLLCEYICKVQNCSFDDAIYYLYAKKEENNDLYPLSSLPEGLTEERVKTIVKKYYPEDNEK